MRALVGVTYNLAKRIAEGDYQIPTGEKGARYLDNIKTAKTMLAELEERYKELLAKEPDAIPGWRLKQGKKVRVIEDVALAFDRAGAYAFKEPSDFWSCCEVPSGSRAKTIS